MVYSQSLFQWVSHRRNLFAITCIAAAHAFFSPVEGKLTGKEALSLRRIVEFWKDGDYEIAKRQIHVFIDQFPKSPANDHLYLMLGDLYFHDKKYQDAYTAYSGVTSEELVEQTMFSRLFCLSQLKDYPAVVDLSATYFQKERTKEELLEAHYLTADALVKVALTCSDPDKQRAYAEKAYTHYVALEGSKYQRDFLFAYAEMQKLLKNYPSALKTYFDLAILYPEQQEELLFQAATLQVFLDKIAAANTFNQVVALKGKTAPAAAFNRLSLLFEMGKHEECVAAYRELQALVPENKSSIVQFYVGSCHFAMGHFQEAKEPLTLFVKSGSAAKGQLKKTLLSLIQSAHATLDFALLSDTISELKAFFPQDSDVAKALLLRAQIAIDNKQFAQGYSDLQEILRDFPGFGNQSSFIYTSAVLLSQDGKWEDSYQLFTQFLQVYPEAREIPLVHRHLVNCSFKMGDKPKALTHLKSLLEDSAHLSLNEKRDFSFLCAKVLYETGQYIEALSLLESYLCEFATASNLDEVHLLSAYCHQKLDSQPEFFILHAEKALSLKPNMPQCGILHVSLFNTYLRLDGCERQAADHLLQAILSGHSDIKWENQLWLTDFYLALAKEDLNHFARAEDLMNRITTAQGDQVNVEALILKYADLLTAYQLHHKKQELLEHLVKQQEAAPDRPWKYQRLALFELARAFEKSTKREEALELYNRLVSTSTHLASYTGSAALLHRSRLQFGFLKNEQKHEGDPQFIQILDDLKELQIRKNLQSEPIHLEAALDYARLRSDIVPVCEQNERYLFFLNRVKEDFVANDDIISKDYVTSRSQNPEKEQLFQSYMAFIDAEIMRTTGNPEGANQTLRQLLSESHLHPYLKERIQALGVSI